ncbi:hypothetical protein [Rhizobium leguminosarum]|uniref:hypothetical protein n=1 Tax=Rhizobium leguminosarum TaxID=384 RepID=UPI001FDFAA29|nr:hypothetical protein [Rhizobium leguminosarum]
MIAKAICLTLNNWGPLQYHFHQDHWWHERGTAGITHACLGRFQGCRTRRGTYARPDRCTDQFEGLCEMPNERANHDHELRGIVDHKLTALIREMEDADWSAEDVAFAINDVLKSKWLDRITALQDAREAVPKGFLSDGNEG